MIEFLKRIIFGREPTQEERDEYRKAKIAMLGAGAGSAVKSDEDGVVRVEELHHEDDQIRPEDES